jgi:TolA-binding protein
MAERITRRQLKEDHFVDMVGRAAAYARENTVVVVIAVLVFIAAITAAVRIGGQAAGVGKGDSESAQALSQARQQFLTGSLESGAAALEQVRKEFGRTPEGREATYILANTYLQMGEPAKAEATYREFLERPLLDGLLHDGALLGIAAAREEAGNAAGALESYREVWEQGRTPGARLSGALAAGRVALDMGRTEEARTVYQAVVDTFPESPEADDARFALLRLDARHSS